MTDYGPQIDAMMQEPLFVRTCEALLAFTGEDKITIEQIDRQLFETLAKAGVSDVVCYCALLALAHMDEDDMRDNPGLLPAAVEAVVIDLQTPMSGSTAGELVARLISENLSIAQLRLVMHIHELRQRRDNCVSDDDQTFFFLTAALTEYLTDEIIAKQLYMKLPPGLLRVYAEDVAQSVPALATLDPDLFDDTLQKLGPRLTAQVEKLTKLAKGLENLRAVAAREQAAVEASRDARIVKLSRNADGRFRL